VAVWLAKSRSVLRLCALVAARTGAGLTLLKQIVAMNQAALVIGTLRVGAANFDALSLCGANVTFTVQPADSGLAVLRTAVSTHALGAVRGSLNVDSASTVHLTQSLGASGGGACFTAVALLIDVRGYRGTSRSGPAGNTVAIQLTHSLSVVEGAGVATRTGDSFAHFEQLAVMSHTTLVIGT